MAVDVGSMPLFKVISPIIIEYGIPVDDTGENSF